MSDMTVEMQRLRAKCLAEKEAADCAMQEAIRLRAVNAELLAALQKARKSLLDFQEDTGTPDSFSAIQIIDAAIAQARAAGITP